MTEETKKQLMNYACKLAMHYDIPNAELVTFKKRNVLLDVLNAKKSEAHKVISDLINASLKTDRIQNDQEKQLKKPEHWNEELAASNKETEMALEKLLEFFKKEGIKN